MWSSVTERRIGTAGVSSTGAAGSSDASPLRVSKTDWISAADLGAGDGVVADMRRDDLGRSGREARRDRYSGLQPFASSASCIRDRECCASNKARDVRPTSRVMRRPAEL